MSSNKIISSKFLSSVSKGGKTYDLHAATKTSRWSRPDVAVEAMSSGLVKAVQASDKELPANTARMVARWVTANFADHVFCQHQTREGDHTSPSDPKDHYTVVLQDKDGNYIRTEHFEKK